MPETKESGLAYEIRLLEARLTKKHNKAIKALENRILGLEGTLARVGEWVARKVEQEAREKAEKDARPVIQQRQEEGEVWLRQTKPKVMCLMYQDRGTNDWKKMATVADITENKVFTSSIRGHINPYVSDVEFFLEYCGDYHRISLEEAIEGLRK